jgi:hypothetical protein
MSSQDALSEYSQKRLGGRPLPADLRALLQISGSVPPSLLASTVTCSITHI